MYMYIIVIVKNDLLLKEIFDIILCRCLEKLDIK